ncbi:MAG: DUF368 domain-containing protein [Clostridium sp.]|nr:DUF368 domain-containing protein [Bacteroides sp.]MCM1199278.1 DUF368 domain-containing protein [Clostridium sp.]
MKRYTKYIMTALKGAGMGAADVIPGVSGGTIAFMTGIYDELVASINSVNMTAVKLLFTGHFREFWKHINGNFLLSLFAGIIVSVLSLAKLMTFLLAGYPIQTWAFFFGLIVASSIYILKDIKDWEIRDSIALVCGIILGVTVCRLSPTSTPDNMLFIFICGAIAICAMILPGISGSFILLLLGKYEFMMGAIDDMNIGVLAVFAAGAVVGILSFSKFLHWLLARFHRQTLIVLAGFIIGSLVKVWPWSNMDAIVKSQYPGFTGDSDSISILLQQSQIDYHIAGAICFALLGIAIVVGLEVLSGRKDVKK